MLTELDFSVGRDAMREKPRNPLIIVATFVSRIPNLGGLCRTAEIFNAECLVVSSLKVKSDPEFLATAVTADRWMPMAEVGEHDLRNYLESKKADGYCLVGIEQATRSVSLETFKFPRKCVVLLGKEREGVPADFLPLLDHILEIPQLGLIRSLNVHVSGALTIWEYTRQTLLDS
ncbi:Alpha/beta knot methyltransferase [Zopfochytrium polystomum]|nr:Alpha/beta knot methyltransferase [Zopfochytrium polystomum]